MRFSHIAPYYDALFPTKEPQLDFLEQSLPEKVPSVWIDIACGSGQQMNGLSGRGCSVVGLDLEEDMILYLKEQYPHLKEQAAIGDMCRADEVLSPLFQGSAGVVYCIGNSIVQVPGREDIAKALSAWSRLLAPGGAAVIQIVNFDRVLNGELNLLPVIERTLDNGSSCTLERKYIPSDREGYLVFETVLTAPEVETKRSHELIALKQEELAQLLDGAGFTEFEWYGDYTKAPWSIDSPATIVKATKPLT